MDDCLFCKIIRGELPSKKVYEDDSALVFENINPVAEIHVLVVPKKHISTFLDLNSEIDSMVNAAQKVIKDKNISDGYKLIVNGGKYQSVPHFHLHLLAGKLESQDDVLNKT
ncbi:MAG TPA: HIT domain-containing protein [Patescibacteria group bacterium]|nr:HIT domain-containing protein [Patescibacteria group bacterium]